MGAMVAEESRNLAIISPLTIDTTIDAETNSVGATDNEAPAVNPENNTYTEITPRSTKKAKIKTFFTAGKRGKDRGQSRSRRIQCSIQGSLLQGRNKIGGKKGA